MNLRANEQDRLINEKIVILQEFISILKNADEFIHELDSLELNNIDQMKKFMLILDIVRQAAGRACEINSDLSKMITFRYTDLLSIKNKDIKKRKTREEIEHAIDRCHSVSGAIAEVINEKCSGMTQCYPYMMDFIKNELEKIKTASEKKRGNKGSAEE